MTSIANAYGSTAVDACTRLAAIVCILAAACAPPPAAAFGASGCEQSITCDAVETTGDDATAIGYQTRATGGASIALGSLTHAAADFSIAMGHGTTASGIHATAMGFQTSAVGHTSTAQGFITNASGYVATAMGLSTCATGDYATAMGSYTIASGVRSTAIGTGTNASGASSTAMGYHTTASGKTTTAMGSSIEASEDEALVNSGSITGKRLGFVADQRLTEDARPANTTALLDTVNALKVFTHALSANYCAHQNWTHADCARVRTTGLLAQQVATALPAAVSTPSTLTLTKPQSLKSWTGANATMRVRGEGSGRPAAHPGAAEVLERVQGVQSLDVHVLIAQLVGAVQAQSIRSRSSPRKSKSSPHKTRSSPRRSKSSSVRSRSSPATLCSRTSRLQNSQSASRSWKHTNCLSEGVPDCCHAFARPAQRPARLSDTYKDPMHTLDICNTGLLHTDTSLLPKQPPLQKEQLLLIFT